MRIGLVGCVKTKLDAPAPARDLYVSPLFRGRRECVERTCARWFILSALHGLVEPDELIEPYDLALSDVPRPDRRVWSDRVLQSLELALGPLAGGVFEIHAGDAYVGFGLGEGLQRRRATVERPLAGLPMGAQLAAYSEGRTPAPSRPDVATRPRVTRSPQVGGGGKYAPLGEALAASSAATVSLSFREVERILGFALPASARRYSAWWQNDTTGSHSHARSWLGAGRTAHVNLARATVEFRRRPPT